MANDEPLPTPSARISFGGAPSQSSPPQRETSSRQWHATTPSGVADEVGPVAKPAGEIEPSEPERSSAPASTQEKPRPASGKLDFTPLAGRFRDLRS